MSVTKNEKLEHSEVKIEFTIEKAAFDAAVTKVFKKKSKDIVIDGFRKGKAPRSVVERMYGKGVFYEDALDELLPEVYPAAVKEAGLNVVGQPKIDVVSMEGDIVLSAVVAVKPEATVENYIGIETERKVESTTDEEVDNEIKTVQNRNSRESDVTDRAAENGDVAKIDYEGFVDGTAFEGGKGKDYDLTLGKGQFIPGFEEQIVGKNAGDEFDVNVTFPEDYHAKELAGKVAIFKVKLNGIKKVELPALDDDFAKDVSEFDTFAAYRDDVKAKITKRHENVANKVFEEKLCDALIERLTADIPETMFAAEAENMLRDTDNRLRMQGMDLNTYFKYTGMTLEKMREQFRPDAERHVKVRLALEAIANEEKIEVNAEEIQTEIDNIAKAYQMEADKVKEMVPEDGIVEDLKVQKAMELVKAKAVIKD